jgi:hypothetical protein
VSTTMDLVSSAPAPGVGDSVTFTATVTAPLGVPAGNVNFKDGAASLGSVTLDGNGGAQLAVQSLTAGAHTITAEYPGTSRYAATSATISQQVTAAPDFSISVNLPAMVVRRGESAAVTLTVAPSNGFSQTVTLTCSASGPAQCNVAPSTVTAAGAPATATVTISVPNAVAGNSRYFPWTGALGLLAVCSIGLGLRRNQPWLTAVVLVSIIGALTILVGCGSRSATTTASAPVSSVVTVTGTSASLQHTTSITVTVQ